MKDVLFSIVCPVYNCEDFIVECINSVIFQTYQNWELIIIDDGSTDNSGTICDDYASKDKRIVVIHQENKGQFFSRLEGIKKSTGDYILFSDSDDYLFEHLLETVLPHCLNNYDAIFFTYARSNKPKQIGKASFKIYEEHDLQAAKKLILLNKFSIMSCKCVKASIIKNLVIDEKYLYKNMGEDFLHSMVLMDSLSKLVILKNQLFFYRQHSNSASHSGKINFFTFPYFFNFGVLNLQRYYLEKWELEDMAIDIYSYWLKFCYSYLVDAIVDRKFAGKTSKDFFLCDFFGDYQKEIFNKLEEANLSKKSKKLLIAYRDKKTLVFNLIKLRIRVSHKVFKR